MKRLFYVCIFAIFLIPGQLLCGDFDELKESIKKNPAFVWGNVAILEHKNDKYLVSVGVSSILSNSPKAKLQARKEARLIAERGLAEFINGVESQSEETLETKYEIKEVVRNGKVVSLEEKESETYTETIREKGGGMLQNVIDIGRWKSRDKKDYLYALGVKIEP